MHILYGGFGLNMIILVSNINQCGQKDSSFEVRHKANTLARCVQS